jgi:hypothetical protein
LLAAAAAVLMSYVTEGVRPVQRMVCVGGDASPRQEITVISH